jgi:hypothetical protein
VPAEAVEVILVVTQALDTLGIPYVIGGSMASTTHGRVRTTLDVDIVADLKEKHVKPLVAILKDDFYTDEPTMHQAITRRSAFNLIHLATMFKVDVFVAKDRPFDRQQLARRQPQVLEPPDHIAYVATPEDIVLAKLEWYRLGGEVSERQWQDIQGVLAVQGERLDRDYLRQSAAELGVGDLLARVWTEYEDKSR